MDSIKKTKFISLFFACVAILTTIFPFFMIRINFFGTNQQSLSIWELVSMLLNNDPNQQLEILNLIDLSQLATPWFLIWPIIGIVTVFLAIVITMTVLIMSKQRFVPILTSLIGLISLGFTGLFLRNIPTSFSRYLEGAFQDQMGGLGGFMANLVDLTNIIEIRLEIGYYLMIIAMIFLFITTFLRGIQTPQYQRRD